MGDVAELVQPPDYGDGDEGGGEGGYQCESCGESEFALWVWNGSPVAVCSVCHKPQEYLSWFEVEDE